MNGRVQCFSITILATLLVCCDSKEDIKSNNTSDTSYSGLDYYSFNSGFNVVAFTFEYFNVHWDWTKVQSNLAAGNHLERPVPEPLIKAQVQAAGLFVSSSSNATSLSSMSRLLSEHAILIIRNETRYCVIFTSGEQVCLFDYPRPTARGKLDEIMELIPEVSGNTMVVSRQSVGADVSDSTGNTSKVEPLSSDWDEYIEGSMISVPSIALVEDYAQQSRLISASATLMNRGDQPLIINEVTGACGCFKQMLGERIIPEHGSSRVTFQFSKDEFDTWNGTQVTVKSNDSTLPVANILVEVREFWEGQFPVVTCGRVVALGKMKPQDLPISNIRLFVLRRHVDRTDLQLTALSFDKTNLAITKRPVEFTISGQDYQGYVLDVTVKRVGPPNFVQTIRATTNARVDPDVTFYITGNMNYSG